MAHEPLPPLQLPPDPDEYLDPPPERQKREGLADAADLVAWITTALIILGTVVLLLLTR